MGVKRDTAKRFWQKVDTSGECWLWLAGKDKDGYGQFWSDRQGRAHRFSFELHGGTIPCGHVVRHKCDNPACVNPAHLTTGTAYDNVHDAVARGRAVHPKKREFCGRGHPMTENNIYQYGRSRACRQCIYARVKAWKQSRRQEARRAANQPER